MARLRQRDAQLRQEEQAHAGNPGDIAGPIDYAYRIGPEGGGMRSAERFPFAPSQ